MRLNRMMTAITLGTLALVLTAIFPPATSAGAGAALAAQSDRQREDFRWQGPVQPGQSVEVRNINGPIRAAPSSSGQVEVTAVKTARDSDVRSVRIVVVPHAQGVTVCALYPDVDGEPNECRPGGGGRNNARDNDVKVEFTVGVPSGTAFNGRTVNGGIEVKDLDGQATLNTVNGSVDLNTTGYANVKTVNGSITARLGRADWEETLELKTVNGSIELYLPSGIDAELSAKTVNGKITSDMPIVMHELSRRTVKGTLGNGGRGLSVETVNGSITLKAGT